MARVLKAGLVISDYPTLLLIIYLTYSLYECIMSKLLIDI
jgi:hypothetical protein